MSQLESMKVFRGTKTMKSKDSVTAYVCTNANGIAKLPMANYFRLNSPPVPYMSQRNAWSDNVTFRRWFLYLFLPFVRTFTSRKCVFIMYNCVLHGTDVSDIRGWVEVLTLSEVLRIALRSIHQYTWL